MSGVACESSGPLAVITMKHETLQPAHAAERRNLGARAVNAKCH
jgi:hypothetical protein